VIVITVRWAAALGILSRTRPVARAPGAQTLRSAVHVGNRLDRLFFGGERSGPAGGGGSQGPWAKGWRGTARRFSPRCLATVCRREWLAAKAVAPPGRRTSPRGTANDLPGAPPARPASRPPRSARNAAVPSTTPAAWAPHSPSSTAPGLELYPRVFPGRSTPSKRATRARAPVTRGATMLACGRRSGTRRTRCTRSLRYTGR
jgi:hypothetical protein